MPVATYQPQPGTIAFRALAHLQAEPGREVTVSMWAEGIGAEPSSNAVCIEPLVRHGLVDKFEKHGQRRPAWFKLRTAPGAHIAPTHAEVIAMARNGHGSALPSEVVAQLSKPVQRAIANGASVEVALERRPDGVDIDRVNRIAESVPNDAPLKIPTFRSAAAAPREAYQVELPRDHNERSSAKREALEVAAFECGLWSSGELVLCRGGEIVQRLPKAEADVVIAFLAPVCAARLA